MGELGGARAAGGGDGEPGDRHDAAEARLTAAHQIDTAGTNLSDWEKHHFSGAFLTGGTTGRENRIMVDAIVQALDAADLAGLENKDQAAAYQALEGMAKFGHKGLPMDPQAVAVQLNKLVPSLQRRGAPWSGTGGMVHAALDKMAAPPKPVLGPWGKPIGGAAPQPGAPAAKPAAGAGPQVVPVPRPPGAGAPGAAGAAAAGDKHVSVDVRGGDTIQQAASEFHDGVRRPFLAGLRPGRGRPGGVGPADSGGPVFPYRA